MIRFKKKSSMHVAALAAVATVALVTNAQAQLPANKLHMSSWVASEGSSAGGQQAAYSKQGVSVNQGDDAIFGDGFGSLALDFSSADPQPNLVEVWAGTFASGDVDGDGDIDLFMSGITPARQAKLYLNDGSGNFSEIASPFPPASGGQAILRDLDGDSDLDLFFSGNGSLAAFTRIYLNNGSGAFAQISNNALPIVTQGADFADVDNDGDPDIIISFGSLADVYLNNGSAVFSPQGSSAFAPVTGVVRFIDVENDGDQDVIISGRDASSVSSTKLYRNDSFGNFSFDANATFAAVRGVDIDVADTDGDGDLDVLLNGNTRNLLYINNGFGIFTEVATSLQQTDGGENEFADLDNDGDQDLLIVGTQAGGLPNIFNIVYKNTGNSAFTQVEILGGEYIAACVIEDFTGDGLKDIIISGFADKTNAYWNTSTDSN